MERFKKIFKTERKMKHQKNYPKIFSFFPSLVLNQKRREIGMRNVMLVPIQYHLSNKETNELMKCIYFVEVTYRHLRWKLLNSQLTFEMIGKCLTLNEEFRRKKAF